MTLPGGSELVIILAIVLLLFGSTRLPKLARSVGESISVFRGQVAAADEPPDVTRAPGESDPS